MRSSTLNPRRDPVMRVATRAPTRQISGRRATHAPYPDRVQPAEVAVQNERQRLARELHDSVAQSLYGITLSAARALALLERCEPEHVHGIVSDMLRLAHDSQTELRALVHDLRSDESDHLPNGLIGALASHAAEFEGTAGCQVFLVVAQEPNIAPGAKATLARIAREALRNVAKHARATQVELFLEIGPSDVTLAVTDDGCGFDPHAAHPGHFGLPLMREQALAIGAALDLVTAPGRGTQVRVRMGRRRR
jgi:signal transduction histidine kinase